VNACVVGLLAAVLATATLAAGGGAPAALFAPDPAQAWAAAGLAAPLGFDEFGRNVASTLAAATTLSIVKSAGLAVSVLGVALLVGQVLSISPHRHVRVLLRLLVEAVEAVPPVLWVLSIFAALREPRLALVTIAFGLVTLPAAVALAAGEIDRLRHEPFVEAAYGLGLSEWTVAWRHLLPNATAVLLPFAFQVFGAALAVDGAVGIIGLGNRTDLDLGTFLMRGKENFALHPGILASTLATYLLTFSALSCAANRMRRRHAAY
jgi:peptide/nickel transport system permease protein